MTGLTPIPGFKYMIGIAYVAIPSDLDRAIYIRDCYSNCQISMRTEDGSFYNRVPISKEDLNFLEFPLTTSEVGTPIVYGVDQVHKNPIVLRSLQARTELGDGKEYQFKFTRKLNNSLVEISGSPKNNALNLIVDGAENSGQINISVYSKNKDCTLKFDVGGEVQMISSGKKTFQQHDTFLVETSSNSTDDKANFEQTITENHFTNQKLIVNGGKDPLARGNELKDFLSNFIDQVAAITVTTELGQMPILNKEQVLGLKDKLDNILSTVVFTDK